MVEQIGFVGGLDAEYEQKNNRVKVHSTFVYVKNVHNKSEKRVKDDSRCWAQETKRIKFPSTVMSKTRERHTFERVGSWVQFVICYF